MLNTPDNVLDIETAKSKFKTAKAKNSFKANDLKGGFRPGENGLNWQNPENEDQPPVWICSELEVTGQTYSITSEVWGRVLEFTDKLGRRRRWVMPMDLLAGKTDGLYGALLRMGVTFNLSPKAKNLFSQYIQLHGDENILTSTNQTGWIQGVYVLPDQTIGEPQGRPIVYQSEYPGNMGYEARGTLNEWKQNVASFAVGNSRQLLAISTAFAAPLMSLFSPKAEGGGFHFVGGQGKGKTTSLLLAGSVWGSHERKSTWRATSNGLEMTAFRHNDNLLLLDEVGESKPAEMGNTVYMLSNGSGKGRMNELSRRGWRLLFLSTGEITLRTAMRAAGLETQAGQEVRMVDIEADRGAHGAFDVLVNGCSNGREQSEGIKAATESYYGVAGVAFIRELVGAEKKAIMQTIDDLRDWFMKNHLPAGADSYVGRVAGRFAIVAAAGEVATSLGLTGWQEYEAFSGVVKCFEDWLATLPSFKDSLEEIKAIRRVKAVIERDGDLNFLDMDGFRDHQPRTGRRLGYVKYDQDTKQKIFCFLSEAFKDEVLAGISMKTALDALQKNGFLKHDAGRKQFTIYPPELNAEKEEGHRKNKVRVYAVYHSILNYGNEGGEEA
ncbi:MAG: DUF927 domain-containing protein [Thiomicrospira sp.]|jgi:putative DNA primase/helicase|nr:DUF927 domain-containing protein [Thiomicrospira sp.]